MDQVVLAYKAIADGDISKFTIIQNQIPHVHISVIEHAISRDDIHVVKYLFNYMPIDISEAKELYIYATKMSPSGQVALFLKTRYQFGADVASSKDLRSHYVASS